MGNTQGSSTNQKFEFNHVPGGFTKPNTKSDNKTGTTSNNNNNLLIDFDGSEQSQPNINTNTKTDQQQNSNNLINLLGDIDFNQTPSNSQALVPVENNPPVNNKSNTGLIDFDFITSNNQNTNNSNMYGMMNQSNYEMNQNPSYGQYPNQMPIQNQYNMGVQNMNQYGMNNNNNQFNMGYNMGGNQNMNNFNMNNNNTTNVKKSADPLDSLFG